MFLGMWDGVSGKVVLDKSRFPPAASGTVEAVGDGQQSVRRLRDTLGELSRLGYSDPFAKKAALLCHRFLIQRHEADPDVDLDT